MSISLYNMRETSKTLDGKQICGSVTSEIGISIFVLASLYPRLTISGTMFRCKRASPIEEALSLLHFGRSSGKFSLFKRPFRVRSISSSRNTRQNVFVRLTARGRLFYSSLQWQTQQTHLPSIRLL